MEEYSILELGEKLASGEITAHSLTEDYLQRIESIDKSGPILNSVIEINPDALEIAEKRDQERKVGKIRGPLHGIPILIKDNIDTRDKMQTTAGSLALEGSHARRDAFLVKRLRSSGAGRWRGELRRSIRSYPRARSRFARGRVECCRRV